MMEEKYSVRFRIRCEPQAIQDLCAITGRKWFRSKEKFGKIFVVFFVLL